MEEGRARDLCWASSTTFRDRYALLSYVTADTTPDNKSKRNWLRMRKESAHAIPTSPSTAVAVGGSPSVPNLSFSAGGGSIGGSAMPRSPRGSSSNRTSTINPTLSTVMGDNVVSIREMDGPSGTSLILIEEIKTPFLVTRLHGGLLLGLSMDLEQSSSSLSDSAPLAASASISTPGQSSSASIKRKKGGSVRIKNSALPNFITSNSSSVSVPVTPSAASISPFGSSPSPVLASPLSSIFSVPNSIIQVNQATAAVVTTQSSVGISVPSHSSLTSPSPLSIPPSPPSSSSSSSSSGLPIPSAGGIFIPNININSLNGSGNSSPNSSSNNNSLAEMTADEQLAIAAVSVMFESGSCLQFVLWDDRATMIGSEIPEPEFVLWDREEQYCLLSYTKYFSVFEMRPTFRQLFTRRISVCSALWHEGSLIYASSTRIEVLFPRVPDKSPLLLASLDPSEAEFIASSLGVKSVAPFLRPIGPISLVKVSNKQLFVLDVVHHLHVISLDYPRLRFFFHAASGKPQDALIWAKFLPPRMALELALFLDALGFPNDAIQVPALSAFHRFEICRHRGMLSAAAALIPQLLPQDVSTGTATSSSSSRSLRSRVEPELIVAEPANPHGSSRRSTSFCRLSESERLWAKQQAEERKMLAQLFLELALQPCLLNTGENQSAIAQLLEAAAHLDGRSYSALVLHYVRTEKWDLLSTLHRKLLSEQNFEQAKWCSLFLGDREELARNLQMGSHFSEFSAFTR